MSKAKVKNITVISHFQYINIVYGKKCIFSWYKNKIGGGGTIPPKYKVICIFTLINDT